MSGLFYMTIIGTVLFHPTFLYGHSDKPYAVDVRYMTEVEIQTMLDWVEAILKGAPHPGKNKPSWISDDGSKLKGTDLYETFKVWHYHCGPYENQAGEPCQWTDNTLATNFLGKTSAQVFHYAKQGDTIVLAGYSRVHNPFPDPKSRSNPLRTRAHSLHKATPFPPPESEV